MAAAKKTGRAGASASAKPVITFRKRRIQAIVNKLPGTFSMDLVDLQAGDLEALRRIVVSTTGEAGWKAAREALATGPASKDGGQSELLDLVEKIVGALGGSLEK
jgi:hypothetical protein